MNGFPYSNFHEGIVHHDVYQPNWTDDRRLEYTLRLAQILSELIDGGSEAGISTLPLGWNNDDFSNEDAASMLKKCIDQLEEIEQQSGKCIHIDLETEPGCRLQRASELGTFINQHFGDDERARRYIRVCQRKQSPITTTQDSGLAKCNFRLPLKLISTNSTIPKSSRIFGQLLSHATYIKLPFQMEIICSSMRIWLTFH